MWLKYNNLKRKKHNAQIITYLNILGIGITMQLVKKMQEIVSQISVSNYGGLILSFVFPSQTSNSTLLVQRFIS